MADVFISYTRADRAFVEHLTHVLGSSGISVWFDRNLTVGEEYGREIEQELRSAGTCVVIWSAVSVDRPWVRSEAQLGHNLGKLVPVMIDKCNIPLPFNGLHSYNLPRDSELLLASPAVQAILEHVKRSTTQVRSRRRPVPVEAEHVKRWLIERANTDPDAPGDFIEEHKLELTRPRFYPMLLGPIDWRAQVTASIGYNREEEYTEQEQRKNPATNTTETVAVKKKRTATTWQAYAAPMNGTVEVALPGSTSIEGKVATALRVFARAAGFQQAELPEAATVVKPEADIVAIPSNKAVVHELIVASALSMLPGDQKKELRFNESINATRASVVYLPLWHGKVSYGGREHVLIASGSSGTDVLFEMPKDQALVADRESRVTVGKSAFWSGTLAGGVGATSWFAAGDMSELIVGIMAAATLLSGVWLAVWPLIDLRLSRRINGQETANAARRARAVAALDPKPGGAPRAAAAPTEVGLNGRHVTSWLIALASFGIGGLLVMQLLGR